MIGKMTAKKKKFWLWALIVMLVVLASRQAIFKGKKWKFADGSVVPAGAYNLSLGLFSNRVTVAGRPDLIGKYTGNGIDFGDGKPWTV